MSDAPITSDAGPARRASLTAEPTTAKKGVAPGILAPIRGVLETAGGPVRRRKLLEELERGGHRISLAGLNRALQQLAESGVTSETDAGVRLRSPPIREPHP